MSAGRLYNPNVSTPVSRRRLRRAGILKVEKHLQSLGYPGRIYIFDTNEFTDEGLESFAYELTEYGQVLDPSPIIRLPMKPGGCHQNVKDLIDRYLIDRPMLLLSEWTGLAYNAREQGWVSHSWGRKEQDGAIIETTTPFDAYYGYRTFYEEYRRQLVESERLREEKECPSTPSRC